MSQATAPPPPTADAAQEVPAAPLSEGDERLVDHLVIGAGFAGLCAAIKLHEAGETDVVVIEKGSDVGGTWRDNTYPGAACDVPSQLYSFSFAPNPDWSASFSPQPEIQAYIQKTARASGVLTNFVFDTVVEAAAWDDDRARWVVRTARTGSDGSHGSDGATTTYAARTLTSGAGGLSEPKLPDIEGIDGFGGEVFHSAQWRHDVDLTGKRVAVIGTGASSIQIVPSIQPDVAHLDVYQRTAPWVIPRNDRRYGRLEKAALQHVPGLQQAYRKAIYWGRETYVPAFTWKPKIAWPAKQAALLNIRKGISDPALRAAVTPDFELGCKRVLISNAYYPALDADNTDLVTDGIARVTPTGIVTADGTERPVDVIIVATGFFTTELPITERLTGRSGRTLAEQWVETGMSAYKGSTVHDFPNLFFLVGPNTGLGHSSMVFMIESQVAYLVDAVRTMRTHAYDAVEVRPEVERAWSADLQERMQQTVWHTGGCASWYLDQHGNNTTLWPRSTFTFRAQTRAFDVAAYRVRAAADAAPAHSSTSTPTSREAATTA